MYEDAAGTKPFAENADDPGGPLVDYALLDVDGVRLTVSTLAHEVGHACMLWHSGTQSNL